MTVRLPVLTEYGSIHADVTQRQAQLLAASKVVNVAPAAPSGWIVTATSYVGSLIVDDVELLIRPKIKADNLFLLLEAGLPEQAWRQDAFDYATTSDLLPSVIAFFARTVETTLSRGLIRSYRSQHDDLVTLRGRLDVARQLRRSGVATPAACSFDEYTEDIAENRILRAVVRFALRVPRIHPTERRRLMYNLVALEGVADVHATGEDVGQIVFNRLNAHYRPALQLARLILDNATLVDSRGSTSAASFVVDMNDLFQRFVTERLRRALDGRLRVVDEPLVYLAKGERVRMYPDLVFHDRSDRVVFAGDVKYKISRDGTARVSDYYQLLAYTVALDLPEGVLIYCLADGGTPERSVTVHHAGKVLHVRSVDLSGSPAAVQAQIDELSEWVLAKASTRACASRTGSKLFGGNSGRGSGGGHVQGPQVRSDLLPLVDDRRGHADECRSSVKKI